MDAIKVVADTDELSDNLKLDMVDTALRLFGTDAAAQLWIELGLDQVPAMHAAQPPVGSCSVIPFPSQ